MYEHIQVKLLIYIQENYSKFICITKNTSHITIHLFTLFLHVI
jgi:hypothetical protein